MADGAERDLDRMLATLSCTRRPGEFTFVTVAPGDAPSEPLVAATHAMVVEGEGTTHVVPVEVASLVAAEHRSGFAAAWLTLDVRSALDAVGLTAAVSRALADVGIACNVLAGHHHDHLLVPADRVDEAIGALRELAATARTRRPTR